ncbi:MAG TPA: class I SAM-dependent methyltransferase [candidate division Zixibacteria bacterium]|nr:class I SAM-dependent methyltransferase [candidate division Zixibacteria bacterium]
MNEKDIVKQGYNLAAEKYLEMRHEDLPEMHLLREFSLKFPEGSKILDAGCGAGLPFTKFLSEKFDVIGVDISEKQIELAKKNVPKAQFICEDMIKLSFPNDTFDGIISYYAIIHIPREEHEILIRNFYKMLKPKGIALLCFHQNDDPGSYYNDFFGVDMFWSGFDWKTNLKILENNGFKILWYKIVDDSLSEDSGHLFVAIQK